MHTGSWSIKIKLIRIIVGLKTEPKEGGYL